MATAASKQTVVIAWAEQSKLAPTGEYVMRDRNYFPEFEAEWEGKAALWLRAGTAEDVRKAEAHAASEGYSVFTFPTSERDPLGKARALALAAAEATDKQS